MPLDFVPKSRQRSIEAAKKQFRNAIRACPVIYRDEHALC
jgi:hypothetical protein